MNTKKYFKEIFETNVRHDPVIDAVRAVSVLSIIAFHLVVGLIQIYDHNSAKTYILNMPSLLQPLWHGEKGVDAFFLLSALVIGIPLFKNIEQYNFEAGIKFFKKKLLRIYPLFLVALVLYTIAQWDYFGKYFFSNLFFLNNLISGERTIIPVGWFLTVEMQYFFLTPFLFLLLKKLKPRGLFLTSLFVLSVVASVQILLFNPSLYVRPITDLFLATDRGEFSTQMGHLFYEADLARFGPFVLGFLLAYLKVNYSGVLENIFKNRAIGTLSILLTLAFLVIPVTIPIYDPSSWYYRPFSTTLNLWVLASLRHIFSLGVMSLILGCWYSDGAFFGMILKIFKLKIWQPISKLSFPMYLFHFPFIAVAAIIVFGTTNVKEIGSVSPLQGVLIFLLATALTFIFSIPLYIYVEKPMIESSKKKAN